MFENTSRVGASGASAYKIDRSLRFNSADDAYIGYTPSSTGNQKVWTWSGWIKRTKIGVYTNLMSCDMHSGEHNNGVIQLAIHSSDKLYTYYDDTGSNPSGVLSDRLLRDTNGWYHIVWQFDAENTSHKIWINGVEETLSGGAPTDYATGMNKASHLMAMGATAWDSVGGHSDLYLAEVHYIDGTKYQASDFGETDSLTGQWVPKEVSGLTYGTNGCYLKFSDNSNTTAATLGKDYSGNGNNWTPNNFSVAAGTGCDSVEDSPTNNYCTLNPNEGTYGTATHTNGNLECAASNAWVFMRGSIAVTSGKWYWEVYGADGNTFVGVAKANTDITNINAHDKAGTIVYYGSDGKKKVDGTYGTYGTAYGSSNVVGVALDVDNGKLYFAEDNTWNDSGDPTSGSTGTGAISLNEASGLVGSQIIPFFAKNGTQFQVNFGQRAFTHTPPSGYSTICASNLTAPTIKDPTKYHETILYTGNDGAARDITDLEFQPDFVWIKNRDAADSHHIVDSVRGANKNLNSDDDDAEETDKATGHVNSFLSNGFQLDAGTQGNVNENNEKYVAWCWKRDQDAGLDIIKPNYANTGVDYTRTHNLGVKPAFVISKSLGNMNWHVHHHEMDVDGEPEDHTVYLDQSTSVTTDANRLKALDSDDITFRTSTAGDHIHYIFAEKEGFSKFGSYIGTSSTDGPFVYCGFKPAYVVLKRTSVGSNSYWNVYDNKRSPVNSGATSSFVRFMLHSSAAEVANHVNYTEPHFYSNGFKLVHGGGDKNYDDILHIFMAFAESPLKYATAR